ncbi:unnamed protein product [Amaranthus hypochondriacus]
MNSLETENPKLGFKNTIKSSNKLTTVSWKLQVAHENPLYEHRADEICKIPNPISSPQEEIFDMLKRSKGFESGVETRFLNSSSKSPLKGRNSHWLPSKTKLLKQLKRLDHLYGGVRLEVRFPNRIGD